jgi:starch synthase
MRGAEARHKGRVCAYIGYNEELAHLVYAGSDFYLMPSRFAPCGLSQMIAMRYGTIPIVRETGGLKDTVEPYNCFTGSGNGFSFANYNADEMYDTILYALGCCSDKKVMRYLISHAMEADFSFDLSAEAYARLYVCML